MGGAGVREHVTPLERRLADQAMENVQEKCLTLEEKAKLKDRLALLKKEYKRTVNLLQKSERVKRVKTHVKRTIEEQNRLLNQQYIEQESVLLSADPEKQSSNASGDLRELHNNFETPSADKEKRPCVSFNLEPEIVNSDSRTPPCSSGESSGQEHEGKSAHQSCQMSRSRLKLSRTARKVCFSESPSVYRVSSIVNILDGKESTEGNSVSPALKNNTEDSISLTPDNPTASYCPENTKPVTVTHEIDGTSGTALIRLGTADNSPGEVKENYDPVQSFSVETTEPNKLAKHCVENASSKSESKEEQPLPTSESLDVDVACKSLCGPLVTPPGALKRENSTDLKTISQASPPLSSESQPPANLKTYADCTVLAENPSPLSSCTLVEGLLFPVEYYVRTTRRMTTCQRKVDLDAVINSHLGTGRKGMRGRSRRNSTSLSMPISTGSKLSNSLTPLSHPSVSNSAGEVTRSRRGRGRKSCPAVISSGLKKVSIQLNFGAENSSILSGSQSEKENCEETLGSKESHNAGKCLTNVTDGSQIKEVERFRTLLSDRKSYSLGSQKAFVSNVCRSADDEGGGKLCNFRSSKEASDLTGSPLPILSGMVNLDHLAHCLNITDFHLPDEDFGILKLEKLKSVNNLELFTLSERRTCGQRLADESNIPPPMGTSAVLQDVDLGACSQISKRSLSHLENNDDCLNNDPSPLRNDKEQSVDAEEPPHSLSKATNALPVNALSANALPTNAQLPLVISVLGAKEKSCSPKKDSPVDPPNGDNHTDTGFIPEKPVLTDSVPQTNTDFLSDAGKQTCIPVIEVSEAAENLGENLDTHGVNPEDDLPDSPTQPNMSGNISSPKELNGSVLFSTSLCSVPLESMNDSVASLCTPGLPCLGSTPAVFSSPHGSNTSLACSPTDKGQGEVLHLEVCGGEGLTFKSRNLGAALDTEDTTECNDALREDKNMAEEGYCGHVENQEKSLPANIHKERSVPVLLERADNEDTEVRTVSGGHLLLVSDIKDSCGGCAVDLCPVWWEFSGSLELCIASASESSVCLWRPQSEGTWECAHIWYFTEMPVIQILPLSQEKNIVCVALGSLEIMEIWALFLPPEKLGWEKQLVKRGLVNTAQGLSRYRLVSSGCGEDGQVVEMQQLSEMGSTLESLPLMPPRNNVLAFCEVDGERDALVGSTVDNYVVIWNAVTGHLLSLICVHDHCSDLTCLSATSDSGLLFLVVRSLFNNPCEDAGSYIFKLIAINPRGGTNVPIVSYVIPNKPNSRYLEGDIKRQKAAAVLTCGSIAVWDLSRSHCSVTLPPSLDMPWCLARWGHSPSHLLFGRKDGTICVYEYSEQCSTKEG